MLKTWHKAITKFATVPNNAGASAIFKLFTARPQLLEKRIERPSAVTVAAPTAAPPEAAPDGDAATTGGDAASAVAFSSLERGGAGQKRRRLF
jgi:hypothetical protein